MKYNYTMKNNLALILAGGSGSRLDPSTPKQFLHLRGKPLLVHTLERFQNHPAIDVIILVTHADFVKRTKELLKPFSIAKLQQILPGGATRQESSAIGVEAAADNFQNILIHDAARPFVSPSQIDAMLDKLTQYAAVNMTVPVTDTIARLDQNGMVVENPDRSRLRRVQTPQGFHLSVIREAHRLARQDNDNSATDDCSLILKYNLAPIANVTGHPDNIKVTSPIDLIIAGQILDNQIT
jgi:2-C-methyl-D-erythritol 4-phosphate cytidylyltransferase